MSILNLRSSSFAALSSSILFISRPRR
jgi:hypothetical protein